MINVKFNSVAPSNLCIFGVDRLDLLEKILLHELDFSVLDYKISIKKNSTLVLNWRVLLFMVQFLFMPLPAESFELKKRLYCAYLFAQIRCMRPKVVVSLMGQYSLWFSVLSATLTTIRFIGLPWTDFREIYLKSLSNAQVTYYVFGVGERQLFEKYGLTKARLHPNGSLVGGYYFHTHPLKSLSSFKLCIISQVDNLVYGSEPVDVPGYSTKKLFDSQKLICEFVSKIAHENDVKICVARRMQETSGEVDYEKLFFDKYLTARYTLVNNDGLFSSYETISNSDIILNTYSTLALDALAAGKKVMFFDVQKAFGSKTDNLTWAVNSASSATLEFEYHRLDGLSQKDYLVSIENDLNYYNNIDWDKPLFQIVRRELESI